MKKEIVFDVGLASKLKQAMIRNGITNLADIDWLCQDNNLSNIRKVRLGDREIINAHDDPIDCDAPAHIPYGYDPSKWSVVEHKPGGKHFVWEASRAQLYMDPIQERRGGLAGNELRRKLEDKPVLNAHVLEYLIEHQHRIPEEWEGKSIFFWGTIYSYCDNLYVLYMFRTCGRWGWDPHRIDYDFILINGPAVIDESIPRRIKAG